MINKLLRRILYINGNSEITLPFVKFYDVEDVPITKIYFILCPSSQACSIASFNTRE